MSVTTKVGKRYTIVIPKAIREKLGLKEGSLITIRAVGNKIIIEPLPENPFEVLGEVIGEPYSEGKDEKRAVEWLMKNAGR